MTPDELPKGYKPTNTIDIIAGAGRKHKQTRLITHGESANTNGSNAQTQMADDETYQIDNFDELLARIIGAPKRLTDLFPETVEAHLMPNTKALRAVVELHKPHKACSEGCLTVGWCNECMEPPYPCPTIQAITDNLK